MNGRKLVVFRTVFGHFTDRLARIINTIYQIFSVSEMAVGETLLPVDANRRRTMDDDCYRLPQDDG